MTTVYKWTTADYKTCPGEANETQWGEGVEHTAPGGGPLCTDRWLHAYSGPLIAVFMDPAHGRYSCNGGVLWECDADVGEDDGTKVGSTRIRLAHVIEPPTLTTEQRVEVGIRAAMTICHGAEWLARARAWLTGEDRSAASAASDAYAAAAHAAAAAALASVLGGRKLDMSGILHSVVGEENENIANGAPH